MGLGQKVRVGVKILVGGRKFGSVVSRRTSTRWEAIRRELQLASSIYDDRHLLPTVTKRLLPTRLVEFVAMPPYELPPPDELRLPTSFHLQRVEPRRETTDFNQGFQR